MIILPPPLIYRVTLGGGEVGKYVYEARENGFSSLLTMKIGAADLSSEVVRTASTYVLTGKPGGKAVRAEMDGRTVRVTFDGKTQPPQPLKIDLVMGNLHPALSLAFLLKARAGTPLKTKVVLLDGPAEAPVTLTALPARGDVRYAEVDFGTVKATYAYREAEVLGCDVPSQKIRWEIEGRPSPFADPLAKFPELSQDRYAAKIQRAEMRTRDGVTLVSTVSRPDKPGRYPVILTRTPYGRAGDAMSGAFWARRGYIHIAQDARGRSESGGAWDPFVNEGADGYDAVEWAAALPYSDGNVGMIGGSYGGLVQWSAAMDRPPHLRCIVPQVTPPDAMRNLPYEYGAFSLYQNLWWSRIVAGKEANMGLVAQGVKGFDPKGLDKLPLRDADRAVFGKTIPFWRRWTERETLSDWPGWSYTDRLGAVKIPVLHLSGWWDGDGIGTHLNWQSLRKAGHTRQWLVIGPWTHAFNTASRLGDEDYGAGAILELDSLYLRWFDTWLKGREVGLSKVPKVRVFAKGANRWIASSDWPLPTSRPTVWHLGQGSLSEKPSRGRVGWTYDPATDTAAAFVRAMSAAPAGSTKLDDDPRETPFRTAPMARDTLVTGPLTVRMRLMCDAPDTDVHAALFVQRPNGERRLIGLPGALRLSYREGLSARRAIPAGRFVTATVRPWDTAHVVRRGERLGLALMPSRFPFFARNLGTMDPIATATRMRKQKVTLDLSGCSLQGRTGE